MPEHHPRKCEKLGFPSQLPFPSSAEPGVQPARHAVDPFFQAQFGKRSVDGPVVNTGYRTG